ncbi:MAG: segregation/condensation protein A [Leptospiraceae bacterium]|nr:segregation/condensation protein A [Leptospiraceae bacterium]
MSSSEISNATGSSASESPADTEQPSVQSNPAVPSDAGSPDPENGAAEPGDSEEKEELGEFIVHWTGPDGDEEGPLSVLWKLIESYRVDIFEISIHRITEDFLSFMHGARDLRISLASSFTVMAARLIYYKSKALLPDPGFEDTEADSRLPPELIQQLLEYRRFQMASETLREMDDISSGIFGRPETPVVETGDEERMLEVSLVDLIRAYQKVLKRLEPEEEEEGYEVSGEEWSVEIKMDEIRQLLEEAISFAFEDLFENIEVMKKGEVIATFLAILELTRLAEIVLQQDGIFGQIMIFKRAATIS